MTTSRKRAAGRKQGEKAKPKRARVKDLDADGKDVKGGVTPTPGGPVPIPYPNVTGRR
jgi:hypothetical protein